MVSKIICLCLCSIALLTGCSANTDTLSGNPSTAKETNISKDNAVTAGTSEYRGFVLDNVYHSDTDGDIHFNLYVPSAYDGSESYALYLTLPGYQGLYFQGVGENLKTETFGFEALKYNSKMIIAAPQLNDWGNTSADQTIALTEYIMQAYNIDKNKAYINGYSGGGETLSLVLDKRSELYVACLMCSSKWDGGYEHVIESKTSIYFVIGKDDEYYGSEPFIQAYNQLHDLYSDAGYSEEEIVNLIVLDIKDSSYFPSNSNQHGSGAGLFAADSNIMEWLFNH